jgi:hypothetical protein
MLQTTNVCGESERAQERDCHHLSHGKLARGSKGGSGRATLTCGALACCGQLEYGTAARSHAHSGTLHVIFGKLKHVNMREAEGEGRGSVKLSRLPFACGSAWRCAGMSASVVVARGTSSDEYVAKGARKYNSKRTAPQQQASRPEMS